MARGRVSIDIVADASGVRRGTRDAERHLSRLNRAGTRAMAGLRTAGIAAGAALGTAFAASVAVGTKELIDQEKVNAQTEARLKSTGSAANVTAKEVIALGDAIQGYSGMANDAIQGGANLILTFTNIRNELGAGNDIFTQATKTMADMSVALDQDLKSSAIQLGKALNDPIRGVTALQRVGVSFTAQQREQIAAMVESGRTLDAQKLILRELNREFGGSAKAFGDTTAGQIEKAKRAWEDFSANLLAKVIPAIEDVVKFVRRNWPEISRTAREVFSEVRKTVEPIVKALIAIWNRFGDEILAIMGFVGRSLLRVLANIRDVVRIVAALIRGDWSEAWRLAGAIVRRTFEGLLDWFRTIPRALLSIGLKMGQAIGEGILRGIRSLADEIADQIVSVIPRPLRSFLGLGSDPTAGLVSDVQLRFGLPSRASRERGGTVPGRRGQAVPIIAHAGEVVLNPAQQRIIGIERIMATLRRTGGILGGDGASLASGGFVFPLTTRRSPIGTPGAGTHTLGNWQSDQAYDLPGPAGAPVFAPVSGTVTRIQGSASAGGQFGGLGIYVSGAGGSYFLKHLGSSAVSVGQQVQAGQRIGTIGDYYGSANHVHFAASSRGLLEAAMSGVMAGVQQVARVVQGHRDEGGGQTASARQRRPSTAITGALARLLRSSTGPGVTELAESTPTGLTETESIFAARAARGARTAARGAGRSPDEVRAAGENAERAAILRFLRRHESQTRENVHILKIRRRKLLGQITSIGRRARQRSRRGLNIAALRRQVRAIRAALRVVNNEIAELRVQLMGIQEEIADLGEQIAAEQYEEQFEAEQLAAANAAESAEAAAPTDAGLSANEAAALSQAQLRAEIAERRAALSAGFLRTIAGASSIEPGGSITINIQALHPGDPQIQAELASWIVGALGGQGSVPTTAIRSPA